MMTLTPRIQGLAMLSLITFGLLLTLVVNIQAQSDDPLSDEDFSSQRWCDWGATLIVQSPVSNLTPQSVISSDPTEATPQPTPKPNKDWDQLVIELQADDPLLLPNNPCEAIRAFYEKALQPDMQVEKVEAQMLTSYPPQLALQVEGFYPDGCQFPLRIVRLHKDNDITIQIYRVIDPATMCAMMLTPFETTLQIGFLEAGNYQLTVNGFEYPLEWEY